MRIQILSAFVFLSISSTLTAASVTLETTNNSDVQLNVSGALGSGTFNPAFSSTPAGIQAILTFDGSSNLTSFSLDSGNFVIPATTYDLTGSVLGPVSLNSSELGFEVVSSNITVGTQNTNSYELGGTLQLNMNSGIISYAPLAFSKDFSLENSLLTATLDATSVITLNGETVASTYIRFQPVTALNEDGVLVTLASINSIELTAVPEPSAFGLLTGITVTGLALARRRR